MKKSKNTIIGPKIGDDAVKATTGKTWNEWFALLDKAGAKKMSHKEIVAYLTKSHGVSSWWRQMVTVSYEQDRGLRDKHQTPQGYQISVSRTLEIPIGKLFNYWQDEKLRKKWLPESSFLIRKATTNQSMRITWIDGKTSVEVMFYSKNNSKAQVVVQHSKLPDAKSGEKMKSYWSKKLDALRDAVSG